MFERFTQHARRVVVLAQEEARMLDHNYIGTEHILLGLIREGDGVAARVIESMGLTLEAARDQVEQIIGRGEAPPSGHIPFTPRAKRVLELALREALELRLTYIGTEHILLGLIRESDGVGAQILTRFATPPTIREKTLELARDEPQEPDQDKRVAAAVRLPFGWPRGRGPGQVIPVSAETVLEFRDALASIDRRLAAIERHLGIDSDGEQAEEAAPEDPAGAAGAAE